MALNASTLGATGPLGAAQSLAADATSLNGLKFKAGLDGKAALKEAAKQFESLFMRELIKSMRQATAKSGLMDGDEGEALATDLFDQQMAVQMTGLPGGLCQAIEAQLPRQMDPQAQPAPGTAAAPGTAVLGRGVLAYQRAAMAEALGAGGVAAPAATRTTAAQAQFVGRHTEAAQRVAADSGIPASFMLGQAGHETGWGRSEIRHADGSNAFNLFGIKATPGWKGKVAEVTTTEYINGEPRKVTARFRAYDSYEASFRDYARMIGNSPRYQAAMQNLHSGQAFATQLQKAGYATDPQYAAKLSRAINATLALQRTTTQTHQA